MLMQAAEWVSTLLPRTLASEQHMAATRFLPEGKASGVELPPKQVLPLVGVWVTREEKGGQSFMWQRQLIHCSHLYRSMNSAVEASITLI